MLKESIILFIKRPEGQVERARLTKAKPKYLFHDIHLILINMLNTGINHLNFFEGLQ